MLRYVGISIACCFFTASAWAQTADDDAPLPTLSLPKAKAAPKPKPKPRPAPRPAADPLPSLSIGFGELTVTGPEDSFLVLDQREVGKLPQTIKKVAAGTHTILVRKTGYKSMVMQATVAAKQKQEIKAQLEALRAVVSIRSDAKGAQVFLNKQLIGAAPILEREFEPGSLSFTVKAAGKTDIVKTVEAKAGKSYEVVADFKSPGTEPVASTPPSKEPAAVIEDDRPLAVAPVEPVAKQSVDIAEVAPAPSNGGLTSKWYFWAGIGAAVVAAAAATTAGVVGYNNCLATPEGRVPPVAREGATTIGEFATAGMPGQTRCGVFGILSPPVKR
jgi:PEGA domain